MNQNQSIELSHHYFLSPSFEISFYNIPKIIQFDLQSTFPEVNTKNIYVGAVYLKTKNDMIARNDLVDKEKDELWNQVWISTKYLC